MHGRLSLNRTVLRLCHCLFGGVHFALITHTTQTQCNSSFYLIHWLIALSLCALCVLCVCRFINNMRCNVYKTRLGRQTRLVASAIILQQYIDNIVRRCMQYSFFNAKFYNCYQVSYWTIFYCEKNVMWWPPKARWLLFILTVTCKLQMVLNGQVRKP